MKNKRYKQATFFDSGENHLSKYFDKNKRLLTKAKRDSQRHKSNKKLG